MKINLKKERENALNDLIIHSLLITTLEIEDCNPQVIVEDIARIINDSSRLMALGVFSPEALDTELMKLK